MLNTITAVLYFGELSEEFRQESDSNWKTTPEDFTRFLSNSATIEIFICYLMDKGYTAQSVSDWIEETTSLGYSTFWEEVIGAFKQLRIE